MKKNILSIFLIGVLISLSSCSDFLDEQPKSTIASIDYCKNETEIKAALNGVYKTLANSNITGYSSSSLPTDLSKRPKWSLSAGLGSYTYTASNSWFYTLWQAHYKGVRDCNYVINSVQSLMENEQENQNYKIYLAQARGVRGYLYFNLMRYFGEIPLVDYVSDNPNDPVLKISRATMDETIKFIISDLDYAALNSVKKDDASYQFGRFTDLTAKGFLAKLYLYVASISDRDKTTYIETSVKDLYQKSIDNALDIMKSGQYKLTSYFPDVFSVNTEDKAKEEVLFAIVHNDDAVTGGNVGMIGGIPGTKEFGGSYGMMDATNFLATFYEQSDSVRRKWCCPRVTIKSTTDESGKKYGKLSGYDYTCYMKDATKNVMGLGDAEVTFHFGKFRRFPLKNPDTYAADSYGNDEPVLRYADILLIYAEAYNELHNSPGEYHESTSLSFDGTNVESAYDAVNLIRKRARVAAEGIIHEDVTPRVYKLNNENLTTPGFQTSEIVDGEGLPVVDEGGNPVFETTILNKACVPDWKPGFYGFQPTKQLNGELVEECVWDVNSYGDDYNAFRIEILNERVRELVNECNDRWFDLSRRNILAEAIDKCANTKNPLLGSFNNTEKSRWVYGIEPSTIKPYMVRLPIPTQEIDANKSLIQNPGY